MCLFAACMQQSVTPSYQEASPSLSVKSRDPPLTVCLHDFVSSTNFREMEGGGTQQGGGMAASLSHDTESGAETPEYKVMRIVKKYWLRLLHS